MAGDRILKVDGLSLKDEQGITLFKDVHFTIEKGDKVVFISRENRAVTELFKILIGENPIRTGTIEWGLTIKNAYLPFDNTDYFTKEKTLIDWLGQFSGNTDENYLRSFLGKMLFSGEEITKSTRVISGGERMRCMIARMMLQSPNVLILDHPTNHLDLESIQAFNNNMKTYPGQILMGSHDHEFIRSVCTRVIELTPHGIIDKYMDFEEYLANDSIKARRTKMYA
jgi:ATPase subunit of ABC transporter with duplicated ATPase domains